MAYYFAKIIFSFLYLDDGADITVQKTLFDFWYIRSALIDFGVFYIYSR